MWQFFCRYCKLTILTTTTLTPTTAQKLQALHWQFHRQTPTTVWDGTASTALRLGSDQLQLKLRHTRAVEAQSIIAVRDEGEGTVAVLRAIDSQVAVWPRLTGHYLYDTRALGISQHLRWRLLVGIRHQFLHGFAHGELGWEWLHQSSRRDDGFSGGMQLNWKQFRDLPTGASVQGEATIYRGQRRQYSLQAEAVWYPSYRDTIFRGRYRFWLRDFPVVGTPSKLQRRLEHSAAGELNLTDRMTQHLQWRTLLHAGHSFVQQSPDISDTAMRFPTQRLRFNTAATGSLAWSAPAIGSATFTVNVQYAEELNRVSGSLPDLQRQRQQEELQDYSSLWTQLHLVAESALSTRDSLTLQATLSLLRYDTPSPANTDDRDEQHLSAQLVYARQWQRRVALRAAATFQGRHTVFLLAPRSAWNHRLYVLALRCGGQWKSEFIHWYPQWEVLASYTVRDYPNTAVLRDFAHRQWQYRDSLRVLFAGGSFGEVQLLLRQSSVGILHWQQFAETPQSSIEELTAAVLVGWSRDEQEWGVGIQMARYRYIDNQGYMGYRQESIGPQARLELRTAWGTIRARGWYEWRRSFGQHWRTVPWLSLSVEQL